MTYLDHLDALTREQKDAFDDAVAYEEVVTCLRQAVGYADDDKVAILDDMFYHAYRFGQENGFALDQTIHVVNILWLLHQRNIDHPFTRADELTALLTDLVVRHGTHRPPTSERVFSVHQAQLVHDYLAQTYLRHMLMYKYVFTQCPRLDFSCSLKTGVPDLNAIDQLMEGGLLSSFNNSNPDHITVGKLADGFGSEVPRTRKRDEERRRQQRNRLAALRVDFRYKQLLLDHARKQLNDKRNQHLIQEFERLNTSVNEQTTRLLAELNQLDIDIVRAKKRNKEQIHNAARNFPKLRQQHEQELLEFEDLVEFQREKLLEIEEDILGKSTSELRQTISEWKDKMAQKEKQLGIALQGLETKWQNQKNLLRQREMEQIQQKLEENGMESIKYWQTSLSDAYFSNRTVEKEIDINETLKKKIKEEILELRANIGDLKKGLSANKDVRRRVFTDMPTFSLEGTVLDHLQSLKIN